MPGCSGYVGPLITAIAAMLMVAASPPAETAKRYEGRTLGEWQQRLGQIDPADPDSARVVPALMAIIQDDELPADIRRPFAVTLGRIGPPARAAIPILIAQIENRKQISKPTYVWAARALGLFGLHAKEAAPALIDLLFDEDVPSSFRQLSIEALARIGTAHPDVLPALIRLLQYQPRDSAKVSDADASVFRELAAEALGIMGPDADLAAPLLVRAVRNRLESASVRRKSIVALGNMRGRAALAIPALMETMEFETTAALRDAAAEALGKIGPPALPALRQCLSHRDPKVRSSAARGLGQMGAPADAAAAALVSSLSDESDEVRVAACEALRGVGVAVERYVDVLIELLGSDARQVRMQAMRLLVALGPQMKPFLERLRQFERRAQGGARALARKTLQKLEDEQH